MQGVVYLIGAGLLSGSGISVRGYNLLAGADIIIFDRLVSISLLSRLPPHITLIDAGKPSNGGAAEQENINKIVLKYAKDGKTVARLKSGDPFLFVRGAEEADLLRENDIKFDVVPGVSAASGAATESGFALSGRGKRSSVFVTTWSTLSGIAPKSDWRGIIKNGGAVEIFMGVARIAEIEQMLRADGVPALTPCAILERAGAYDARTVFSSLAGLAQKAAVEKIISPSLIIINAANGLNYHRPLSGNRIILTRPFDKNLSLFDKITAQGGEAIIYPLISTVRNDIAVTLL